jgi:ATP-dependent Zn protease
MHNLISTSYHEAGHTIYALLHLMKVESVQVFPDGKEKENNIIGGFTHFSFFTLDEIADPDILNYAVNAEICLRYAGLASEKHHFKTISGSDKFPMFLKDGSSEDTQLAAQIIKQYSLASPGKKRYTLKKKLIKNTLNELLVHWDDVNLIAHRLFKSKRIYFDDLKQLLTKNSENKMFWRAQFKEIKHIYDNYKDIDEKQLKIILDRLNLL